MEQGPAQTVRNGASMFNEEDLKEIYGLKVCEDRVEVTCGCTSHQYGDAVGLLRVFPNGDLQIKCECTPGCDEDKLTPAAFEKHSGRETTKKWKKNVWVITNGGEKVPLAKTILLKYYNQKTKPGGRPQIKRGHRDEFVTCTRCGKMRRFRLRNKKECRVYHDALGNANWSCSDSLDDERVTCGHEEERASRRVYRGCSRLAICRGCTFCVCFGCETCRFSDCSCQTCTDFTKNAKN